jgi:YbbR domain-containing protein
MLDLSALDLGRAAWAFALSLALWLFVQTELNPERADVFELSVEAQNVPTGLVVTNEADWRPVQVRLSAPREVFAQLRPSQLRAVLDLSRVGPGESRVPVSVPSPDPQVRVGEPNPRQIAVRVEERISKSVPVRVRLDGSLPFGYRTGRATVSPESVTVTGPASYVRRAEAAQVEVRLDAATSDVDSRVQPSLVDGQGERLPATAPGLDLQPASARVQLPITQQVGYKEIGVHPALQGNVPAGYLVQRVAVDPAVVTAIGEPQVLGEVTLLETESVDLAAATGDFNRQVRLRLPEGLSLARPGPVTVSVQVTPLALRQTLRVPVGVQNVSGELFQASEVPVVEVAVTGPADSGIGASEIQATVDAGGLGPGAYTLPVRVRLPEGYTLEAARPDSVRVVLQDANSLAPAPPPPPAAPTAAPAPSPTPEAIPVPTEEPPVPIAGPTNGPIPLTTATPVALTSTAPLSASPGTPTATPPPTATRSPTPTVRVTTTVGGR